MMWLAVLPMIIDLVKAATRLITELDQGERQDAKQNVRMILEDYSYHGDVETVRANLEQFISSRRGSEGR